MINKVETTELLKKLVSISSPYFEEQEIMEYAKAWFCKMGMKAFIHEYHEDKVTGYHGQNVLLELEGTKPGPVICLNGHLDSVKLCNGWTKDSFGEVIEDKLYGLGALDMKSGCASIMVAVEHFFKEHKDFAGKIKVSLVSVEEGPYGMGTNALIEDGYLDDVDFSIITEPSAGFTGKPFPDLCLGARGGYGLEIEFYGKSAHAASPENGISAVEDAAKVVLELKNIEYVEDPHLGKGTCCVVAINSDGGACSVPDFASIKMFWHIVVGEGPDTITKQIEEAIKRAGVQCQYKIKFREAPSENSKGYMPYTVSEDDIMVGKFIESITKVTDKKPSISYFSSIGDFCYLGTRINAPAVIFGAAGENYHSEDEYVTLDSVHKTSEVIFDFLVKTLV
ncbi:MAG: M20/M25/M40 family metallo-hydrolase [Clostridium sp.]|uniref:M20 family metallopeptidase n=1 Tax=Clostridium sp. TaxID=1506 RepID=UPI00302ADCFC